MTSQPHLLNRPLLLWLVAGLLPLGGFRDGPRADEPAAATSEPEIRVLDWAGTQKLIESEYPGRVVVVNLWTNTCPACLEGFPGFAGLLNRYDRDEFACLSLNCDYDGVPGKPPEYYRPRVIEFLKQQRNGIDHVMLSDPLIDFMEEVNLNSTPALFVFDRDGELVRRFDNDEADSAHNGFTMEEVETAVRELLEVRNPKHEIRNKSATQNSNVQNAPD